MAIEETAEETTVSDRGMVTVPANIRRRLDIEAGDKLRWTLEEGSLTVDVVHQERGAFDDAPTADLGGDGLETHDLSGHEPGPSERR